MKIKSNLIWYWKHTTYSKEQNSLQEYLKKKEQIDNIFLDKANCNCISIYPMINRLSDHDPVVSYVRQDSNSISKHYSISED